MPVTRVIEATFVTRCHMVTCATSTVMLLLMLMLFSSYVIVAGALLYVPVERGEARPSPSERALDLPPVPPPPVTVKQLVEDPPTEDTLDGIGGIDGIEGDDSPMTENVPLLSSMRLLVGIQCSWRLSVETMRP